MAKKKKPKAPENDLEMWKVMGVFAFVFAVLQLTFAAVSIGISYLKDLVPVNENMSVFLFDTISHAVKIAV